MNVFYLSEMLDAEMADVIPEGDALDDYLAATEKLDQELQEELERQSEPPPTESTTAIDTEPKNNAVFEESESRNKTDTEPRHEALFLYGVDEMSTQDIEKYCNVLPLQKIEWINDSSCKANPDV